MQNDAIVDICDLANQQAAEAQQPNRRRKSYFGDERAVTRCAHRVRVDRRIIHLTNIEFRILSFLVARPYHAFTRRQIVKGICPENDPVTERELDNHVASLRSKLGLFHDYVQTVPYIGYRFKE